jgi:hypothetical protein
MVATQARTKPTAVPLFTADQWARRVVRLFPKSWTRSAARTVGGILYSICNAIGSQAVAVQAQLQFVLNAERIATATDVALDAIANDLFTSLPRLTGEPDTSYRARIYANLFPERGTRPAIIKMFTMLTGQTPRVIEPWNINDCAVMDRSFVDIDTVQFPSRVSDSGMRKTIMIESVLPSFGNQGTNPVYGLDQGLAVDYGWIVDTQPTWFLGKSILDNALTQTKMGGTTAYRRYTSQALVTYSKAGTTTVLPGKTTVSVQLAPPISGPYVLIASTSWMTQISASANSASLFTLNFSAPPPVLSSVDWMILPLTALGGVSNTVNANVTSAGLSIPSAYSGYLPFAICSWNSEVWITSIADGVVEFEFGAPSIQTSQLHCAFLPAATGGSVTVPAGQTSFEIDLPSGVLSPYQAFAMPTWNTSRSVKRNGTSSLIVTFEAPPPVDSTLYWSIRQQAAGAIA